MALKSKRVGNIRMDVVVAARDFRIRHEHTHKRREVNLFVPILF